MYYPEGMKARVSPVQSIEPHRILAPTRDSNLESLGPESRVVTTILPLHTYYIIGRGMSTWGSTWATPFLFIYQESRQAFVFRIEYMVS